MILPYYQIIQHNQCLTDVAVEQLHTELSLSVRMVSKDGQKQSIGKSGSHQLNVSHCYDECFADLITGGQ